MKGAAMFFLKHAIDDMHAGRESWRVLTLIGAVSFAIAVAVRLTI